MISADIKTDVKQEIKKLAAVSYNFSQKYLLNFSQKYLFKTCGLHSIQPNIVPQEWGELGERGRDEG